MLELYHSHSRGPSPRLVCLSPVDSVRYPFVWDLHRLVWNHGYLVSNSEFVCFNFLVSYTLD